MKKKLFLSPFEMSSCNHKIILGVFLSSTNRFFIIVIYVNIGYLANAILFQSIHLQYLVESH